MPVSASDRPISLFVADDHKIIRDGLRVLIERDGRFVIAGEASSGRALVEGVNRTRPDVVITDLSMQDVNGIEAVRQLRAGGYRGAVVMLSMHDERRFISQALEAGVNAYVHKDHAFDQVVDAIMAARRGEVWLSPELAPLANGATVQTLDQVLSPRERDVLALLAEGLATKEVASRLSLSPKTVEVHRLHLFAKLRVNNVVDLTRIAIREGLVQL